MDTQYNFTPDNVEQLNSFIRGELSAVETYEQALLAVQDLPPAVEVLTSCLESHGRRAQEMSSYVRRLGGIPPVGSGAWGSLVRIIEGGAKAFGPRAAISALEQGEDHGLMDYRRDLDELSEPVRAFVEQRILPEQVRTHAALNRLRLAI